MASLTRRPLTCLLLFTLLVFTACATQPKLSDLNAEQRACLSKMLVFNTEGLPQGSYQKIGRVESVACKKSFDKQSAVTKIKILAAQLGADAVINLSFQTKDEVDWTHDCWATVVGTADAVRIKNSGAVANQRVKK
jgi:hypothetical protein